MLAEERKCISHDLVQKCPWKTSTELGFFSLLGTNLVKKAICAMVEGDCDEVSMHTLFRDLLILHTLIIVFGQIGKEY